MRKKLHFDREHTGEAEVSRVDRCCLARSLIVFLAFYECVRGFIFPTIVPPTCVSRLRNALVQFHALCRRNEKSVLGKIIFFRKKNIAIKILNIIYILIFDSYIND